MIGSLIHKLNARVSFARFGRHDLTRFLKAWAKDAVFIYPGTTSLAGRFEGRKAIEDWFRKYMDHFPQIEFTVRNVCVQRGFGVLSNVIAVEWDVAVRNKKGEDFVYAGVSMIEIRRAKAVLVKDYIFDTSVLARALA